MQPEEQKERPVLIVGSVALDTIETPFGQVKEVPGGAAYYAAIAASFYTRVRLVAVVGEDFPSEHLDTLRRRGVDLEGLQVREGRTFRWQGRYQYDMSQAQTIGTQLNVFEDFQPEIPPPWASSEFVFLANIDPDLQLMVLDQVAGPRLVAADTMNFWIEGKRDAVLRVLQRADMSLLNDAEVRQLSGVPGLASAARKLLGLGPKIAVIKKGEHGAVMFSRDAHFAAPSYPLEEVRDPTGAGDSFAGALVGYLASRGEVSEAAVRRAIVHGGTVASFTVEDFGAARLLSLTRGEIETRYREMRAFSSLEPMEFLALPEDAKNSPDGVLTSGGPDTGPPPMSKPR